MGEPTRPWVHELAGFVLDCFRSDLPADVVERASLHLFDTIGCAAGAHDAPPVAAARRAVAGSGPAEATIFFGGGSHSVVDAILVNGAAVRYLDANDVPLSARTGPGGHPSDNIVVALAMAERAGSSGRDTVAAIVLGYELATRFMSTMARHVPGEWDHVSWSGIVAASMASVLIGADADELANAIAIAASKGYALKAIRHGEISMLKAAGNALVAREGALAAMLAAEGMTGPPTVFEGKTGLIATMGGRPEPDVLADLCAPPIWAIRRVSIKAFPAIGTSQAALHAGVAIASEEEVRPEDVSNIMIHLPATKWTERTKSMPERLRPTTRESADHSIPFLVALALTQGGVTQAHFEQGLWQDPRMRSLMDRTILISDETLTERADTAFPAVVEVTMRDGRMLRSEVIDTPGSPSRPWGRAEIAEKFRGLDRAGVDDDRIDSIGEACLDLPNAESVESLMALIRD
jgi:2-methylcitrate dehydratase